VDKQERVIKYLQAQQGQAQEGGGAGSMLGTASSLGGIAGQHLQLQLGGEADAVRLKVRSCTWQGWQDLR
jgi:hypothetical protein